VSEQNRNKPEPRQLYLPYDTSDYFHLLHGGHDANIAVCEKVGDKFKQRMYPHDQALYAQVQLACNHDTNVYQSQNGFRGNRRLVNNVSAITSFYVDFDTYKIPELDGIEADDLLTKVLNKYPWLPVPTAIFDSGRGFYMEWVFSTPIDRGKLPRWQEAEVILVELLKSFGADPGAKDAARVLRVIGSINTKNGEKVEAYVQTGERVSFSKVSSVIINNGLPLLYESKEGNKQNVSSKPYKPTDRQKISGLSRYQLMLSRMGDCQTLAGLRGSPFMGDYRARLLFVYAASGVCYWSSVQQAEYEIDQFCQANFHNGLKYGKKNVGTVLNRFRQHKSGVVMFCKDGGKDIRYHLGNKYIINLLEISLEEQKAMATLITQPEKDRRREVKRRDQGMIPREEYLQLASAKRERVAELRRRYWSIADIAAELGLSKSTVQKCLGKGK
jgi:hypothetical protein